MWVLLLLFVEKQIVVDHEIFEFLVVLEGVDVPQVRGLGELSLSVHWIQQLRVLHPHDF